MDERDLTSLPNLKSLIDYAAESFGDTEFLCWKQNGGVASKTYTQLKKSCDAFSRMLGARGFNAAHVAVVGPTSYEWIVTYFGTANSGGAVIPIAPSETDEMNCRLMEFADTEVFVFDKKHEPLYLMLKEKQCGIKLFISVDNTSEYEDVYNIDDLLQQHEGEFTYAPDPDTMCAIVFTSGTTGFPKGVMLSHKNFIYSATSVHVACPTKRMFCCLPIHHCFCFTANITKSIARGKTVCVNDSLANLVSDLQLYKPDSIIAVPQIVKKLMNGAIRFAASKPELPTERAVRGFFGGNIIDIISGGAPLEAEANERFNATGIYVFNGYGMTECAPIIANNALGCFRHGSVGKPIPCMEVKIENGEILVKGPSVMLGYYKNPDATAEAFTPDGWLHTGDVGHFDDDGFLYVTGRCKNLILLDNGENVSAEMLEARFENEPLIKEVVCTGDNGAISAQVFPDKTYMAENGIENIDDAMVELLLRVNAGLASYQRISSYTVRDIPFERTSSSKIKRSSVQVTKRKAIAPVTAAEKRICAAVGDLLMLNEVSVADNFFAIGGNSLNALELAVTLNINVQLIYDKPFLGVLAAAVESGEGELDDSVPDVNSLIAKTKTPDKRRPAGKCALLTGATGFLGVHILWELVKRGVTVYCLVRDPKRLSKQLEYYFGSFDMTNVKAVTGNIESADLGLSETKYKDLCDKVDMVFHVAANVHHAGDYADLERTNVTGTKNVIAFAKKADAVLHHTSTVSVHGAATVIEAHEDADFDENTLDIGQHYRDNVYIHSKFRAEEAILLAREDGLDANIYRIGNLTWRAEDGKFQKNSQDNGFLRRVHATLKLGLYNSNMDKYPMDLTPVDLCAKAYVALAFNGRVNEIYHMYNPNYLATQDMFKLLGVPYKTVSGAQTVETVMANMDDRDIHVYMFYLIISGRSSNAVMKNDYTVSLLEEAGFRWNTPDRAYLTADDGGKIPNGHCLAYSEFTPNPPRENGGIMTPIQKLALGALRDAQLRDAQLIDGAGSLKKLPGAIAQRGVKKPLVVTYHGGAHSEAIGGFIKELGENIPIFDNIQAEPQIKDVEEAMALYEGCGCDSVVAIGGGSVLDVSKIIALKAANPGQELNDLCKLYSRCNPSVPVFAVPTTAGTGSDVTLFAVITDENGEKTPFVSDKFLPEIVVLDPLLTVSVPAKSTAYTGIDALSHAVEAYIGMFAEVFSEDRELAPIACKRIFKSLETACKEPGNIDARAEMQRGAYEAGLAFRRIGTAYIHAVAHRLGEFYHIPHGQAIAAAFAPILKATMPCGAGKLGELALLCGIGNADNSDIDNANAFIAAVEELITKIGADSHIIPFDEKDLPEIVNRAQEEAKRTGYPRPFTDDRLAEIIKSIFA